MSGSAREWLDDHARGVPATLLVRMREAVAAADADAEAAPETAERGPGGIALHTRLAEAALSCLQEAAAHGDERSAAIHLLAADALITAACEVAAGAGALDEIAAATAAERLAVRMRLDARAANPGGAS